MHKTCQEMMFDPLSSSNEDNDRVVRFNSHKDDAAVKWPQADDIVVEAAHGLIFPDEGSQTGVSHSAFLDLSPVRMFEWYKEALVSGAVPTGTEK